MQTNSIASLHEQRVGRDRRARPTSFWSALRLRGRRRAFRRAGEGRYGYVDCPAPLVIALVLWVTVCSALDAFFTLLYVANGGGEANPLMTLALSHGSTTFVGLKMSVTCVGAWLLSVLQQFPLAYIVLYGTTLMYLGILSAHAVILLS